MENLVAPAVARLHADLRSMGLLYAWRMTEVMVDLLMAPGGTCTRIVLGQNEGFNIDPLDGCLYPKHIQWQRVGDSEMSCTVLDNLADAAAPFVGVMNRQIEQAAQDALNRLSRECGGELTARNAGRALDWLLDPQQRAALEAQVLDDTLPLEATVMIQMRRRLRL